MTNPSYTDTLTKDEASFAADMLTYYRRAGHVEAMKLYDRMKADSDNGCYREDHRRTVKAALSKLPTIH